MSIPNWMGARATNAGRRYHLRRATDRRVNLDAALAAGIALFVSLWGIVELTGRFAW
jgi:hypothetical protein